jgi:hypothetical protein
MADTLTISKVIETLTCFVILARGGIQTCLMASGFIASFVKRLGSGLPRVDVVASCDGVAYA